MPAEDAQPNAERIQELYWNSDRSVSEVADELGISRRTLYRTVEPAPANAACPECGEALVYPNRSARTAGEAECAACETTRDVTALEEPVPGDEAVSEEEEPAEAPAVAGTPEGAEAAARRPGAEASPEPAAPLAAGSAETRWRKASAAEAEQSVDAVRRSPIDAEPALSRGRTLMTGIAAAAGVAIGAIAAFWSWRRD